MRALIHSFARGNPAILAPFVEEIILSLLSSLDTLPKKQLITGV